MNPWRILITPLHWGLGHATRCVPIIRELLSNGIEVYIASDGDALRILQEEFPQCVYIALPAYNIHYKSQNMIWNLAKQSFKILTVIRNERLKIMNIIDTYKINLLITDNRFGAYSHKIPCIFITHQLHIRIPNKFLSTIVNQFNYQIIKKYAACWVPDLAHDSLNLSGALSHNSSPYKNIKYIGALSRLVLYNKEKIEEQIAELPFSKKLKDEEKNIVLLLLSGPEPQRSFFEEKLIEQAKGIKDKFFILVRGVVNGKENEWTSLHEHIYSCNYLQTAMLSTLIQRADFLVSRSGYSTIMDYFHLQRKHMLLVPTPGQTEQEYLAETLAEKNIAITQNQNNLDLQHGLRLVVQSLGFENMSYEKFSFETHILPLLPKKQIKTTH